MLGMCPLPIVWYPFELQVALNFMQFSAQLLLHVSLFRWRKLTQKVPERERKDFALRITMTFGNCRGDKSSGPDESPKYPEIHFKTFQMCSFYSTWVKIKNNEEKCTLNCQVNTTLRLMPWNGETRGRKNKRNTAAAAALWRCGERRCRDISLLWSRRRNHVGRANFPTWFSQSLFTSPSPVVIFHWLRHENLGSRTRHP